MTSSSIRWGEMGKNKAQKRSFFEHKLVRLWLSWFFDLAWLILYLGAQRRRFSSLYGHPTSTKSGTKLVIFQFLTFLCIFFDILKIFSDFWYFELKTSWAAWPILCAIVYISNRWLPLTQKSNHIQVVWEQSSSKHEELDRERMNWRLAEPNEILCRTTK